MATKHTEVPVDNDAKILVDIDLSILGQSEDVFDEYEVNIRKEYAWVPEADFRVGRSKVLQSFLDRERIYSTDYFYQKYEEKARANLKRSIEKLASS